MTKPLLRAGSIATLLCVGSMVSQANAQTSTWLRQLGTTSDDDVRAAAQDGVGGVFVVGSTWGSLGGPALGGSDAWLARYDEDGVQLWARQLGTYGVSDDANAASMDGQGGLYLGGSTPKSLGGPNAGQVDAWLARYDAGGNQLWIRQLGSDQSESAQAMALGPSNDVFVCGGTSGILESGAPGNGDAWLARYDELGNKLWLRQFGTTEGEQAFAVAVDGAGGCFVAGETTSTPSSETVGLHVDAWLAHFDGAGNLSWFRIFGTGGSDTPFSAAPGVAGQVYVCGWTNGSLGAPNFGDFDGWIGCFDRQGEAVWLRQIGTRWHDKAQSCAPDGEGGVYVCGLSEGSLGAPQAGSYDAWLGHYDASGNQTWVHGMGSSEFDTATAVAPDRRGGVFLSGATKGSFGGVHQGKQDAWIARISRHCGMTKTYCGSTSSAPTCSVPVAAAGLPILSQPAEFTIHAEYLPGVSIGACLFSNLGPASTAVGRFGLLSCVQAPYFRTQPKPTGGWPLACTGQLAFSLQDLIDASPIVTAGAVLNAQLWARIPSHPGGLVFSNGLEFTVCP